MRRSKLTLVAVATSMVLLGADAFAGTMPYDCSTGNADIYSFTNP